MSTTITTATQRPTYASANDAELGAALRTGDPRALSALYDRMAPSVYALCLRILGPGTAAEDALADIFASVWAADRQRGSALPLATLVMLHACRILDRRAPQRSAPAARRPTPLPAIWLQRT